MALTLWLKFWAWLFKRWIVLSTRPRLFKRWIVLFTGKITIQRIIIMEINCVVQWIVIYLLDSAIHLSNNRALTNTLQWISIMEINCNVQWIVIYLLDSAIHLSNNRALTNTLQWISIMEINCNVQWIGIYPVDGTIHLLNNWRPFSNHYTIKWIVLTANTKEAVSKEKCESYRKQVVHPQALEEETTG